MRHLWRLVLVSVLALPAFARGPFWGWAQRGGQKVEVTSTGIVIKGQQSCPGALVTIREHGTAVNATIYSTLAGTAKDNPFAASDGAFFNGFAEDGLYDVLVQCSSPTSWSLTYTIQVGGTSELINVANFGAVGDAQYSLTAGMLSGSTSLTIGSALFAAADVGKLICVSASGAASSPTCGTITAFNSTTNVTTSFSNTSGGDITNKFAVWGTDSTAAFVAAEAAITATNSVFYIPSGGYIVRPGNVVFNVKGTWVRGDGWESSIVYAGSNSSSALFTGQANGAIYSDFKLWNGYDDWTHTGRSLHILPSGNDTTFHRVWLRGGYDLIYQDHLDNIIIDTCIFEASRRHAYHGYNASLSKLINNTFYANSIVNVAGAANIKLDYDPAYIFRGAHNTISHNYFLWSRYGHFIQLNGVESTSIEGNFFSIAGMFDPGQDDDINLTGATYTAIVGNTSTIEYNNYIAGNRGSRYVVNADGTTTELKVVGNAFEAGTTGVAIQTTATTGIESIGSDPVGTSILIQRALAGAFVTSQIKNISPTGSARFIVSSGDGTTSNQNAYFLSQSLETSASQWLAGLVASKAYSVWNGVTGVRALSIDSITDIITATNGLVVPDGKYLQPRDNNVGAPAAGDCDNDTEQGRLSFDYSATPRRMYICTGATGGWDYVELTN